MPRIWDQGGGGATTNVDTAARNAATNAQNKADANEAALAAITTGTVTQADLNTALAGKADQTALDALAAASVTQAELTAVETTVNDHITNHPDDSLESAVREPDGSITLTMSDATEYTIAAGGAGYDDTALAGRVSALENAPPVDITGKADQTALDAEATTRGQADTALDNRVTTLENEPDVDITGKADQTSLDAEVTARTDADALKVDKASTSAAIPVDGSALATNYANEKAVADLFSSIDVTGQPVTPYAATFAALAAVPADADGETIQYWTVLTTDDVGTGTAEAPQYPKGIYLSGAAAADGWSFAVGLSADLLEGVLGDFDNATQKSVAKSWTAEDLDARFMDWMNAGAAITRPGRYTAAANTSIPDLAATDYGETIIIDNTNSRITGDAITITGSFVDPSGDAQTELDIKGGEVSTLRWMGTSWERIGVTDSLISVTLGIADDGTVLRNNIVYNIDALNTTGDEEPDLTFYLPEVNDGVVRVGLISSSTGTVRVAQHPNNTADYPTVDRIYYVSADGITRVNEHIDIPSTDRGTQFTFGGDRFYDHGASGAIGNWNVSPRLGLGTASTESLLTVDGSFQFDAGTIAQDSAAYEAAKAQSGGSGTKWVVPRRQWPITRAGDYSVVMNPQIEGFAPDGARTYIGGTLKLFASDAPTVELLSIEYLSSAETIEHGVLEPLSNDTRLITLQEKTYEWEFTTHGLEIGDAPVAGQRAPQAGYVVINARIVIDELDAATDYDGTKDYTNTERKAFLVTAPSTNASGDYEFATGETAELGKTYLAKYSDDRLASDSVAAIADDAGTVAEFALMDLIGSAPSAGILDLVLGADNGIGYYHAVAPENTENEVFGGIYQVFLPATVTVPDPLTSAFWDSAALEVVGAAKPISQKILHLNGSGTKAYSPLFDLTNDQDSHYNLWTTDAEQDIALVMNPASIEWHDLTGNSIVADDSSGNQRLFTLPSETRMMVKRSGNAVSVTLSSIAAAPEVTPEGLTTQVDTWTSDNNGLSEAYSGLRFAIGTTSRQIRMQNDTGSKVFVNVSLAQRNSTNTNDEMHNGTGSTTATQAFDEDETLPLGAVDIAHNSGHSDPAQGDTEYIAATVYIIDNTDRQKFSKLLDFRIAVGVGNSFAGNVWRLERDL